jgi:hypothetical protein
MKLWIFKIGNPAKRPEWQSVRIAAKNRTEAWTIFGMFIGETPNFNMSPGDPAIYLSDVMCNESGWGPMEVGFVSGIKRSGEEVLRNG